MPVKNVASRSLTTFGYAPTELGDALIRIALSGHTTSATAVFNAIIAFSAIHRNDVNVQAGELKIAAIKALTAASGGEIGTTEAIQHIAAGMLLLSYEVTSALSLVFQVWYVN